MQQWHILDPFNQRIEGRVQGFMGKLETIESSLGAEHPKANNNNLIFLCSHFVAGWISGFHI